MRSEIKDFVSSLYGKSSSVTSEKAHGSAGLEPSMNGPLVWCAPVVRNRGAWQVVVEVALIVALFPILIVGGVKLPVRTALALSLVVIACCIALFLFLFGTRRPHPRELVVIATLIAIAVAGRSAFFMLPQFKPVAAIVIIAGVSLGQETGFIVGALTALVSNIFFGQGPWTPWQMLAFGLMGFVAGALHYSHVLPATRLWLCVYGFLSCFFIYGLIMNPSSLLMYGAQITPASLLGICISGAPMDAIQAIATVIFLAVLARPFIEKLERLKVKYGLV